jgi:hypothetical protein
MTFFSRGTIWVWQCSPSSTMIQRRPILCHGAGGTGTGEGIEDEVAGIGGDCKTRFRRRSGFG